MPPKTLRVGRIAALLLLAAAAPAHAFRCGTRIITRGDHADEDPALLRRARVRADAARATRATSRDSAGSTSRDRRRSRRRGVDLQSRSASADASRAARERLRRGDQAPRLRLLATRFGVAAPRAAAAPAPSRSRSPRACTGRGSACRAGSSPSCAPSARTPLPIPRARARRGRRAGARGTGRPAELARVPTLARCVAEHHRDDFNVPSMVSSRLFGDHAARRSNAVPNSARLPWNKRLRLGGVSGGHTTRCDKNCHLRRIVAA